MGHAATYHDFNFVVWHDSTARTGAENEDEHLYHSVRDANEKAKALKRRYPRDPVIVIDRSEYDARRRADEEYSRQNCR